jgi:hypothetical protein
MLKELLVVVGGSLPSLALAQSTDHPPNESDRIVQSIADDERLTWLTPTRSDGGGPNASFSLDAAYAPEPEPAAAMAAAAAVGQNESYGPNAGNFEFTLAGSGVSSKHFENSVASVSGGIGYFLTSGIEIAGRQDFLWVKGAHSDNASASRVALDLHLDLDILQPFIGANFGYVYGELVENTFEAAPEAGLKIFVKRDTFIYGIGEYRFFFDTSNDIDTGFDEGEWVYSVGVGFTF